MKTLLLFDMDNTLTLSRGKITLEMKELIKSLDNSKYELGVVSGSDLNKIKEQLEESANNFTWIFTENGLVTYFNHQQIPYSSTSLVEHLGEGNYQELVNECLWVLCETKLPVKRGVFLELRTGLLNICPVGRTCSQKEREEFEEYDKKHKVRERIVDQLSLRLKHLKLKFSIGGQISIDAFPEGWDKTYCLQFINGKYDEIKFYGDNIRPGGNDYEIGIDKRVKAYSVTNWKDTFNLLSKL
jgi:phosphomannomutase